MLDEIQRLIKEYAISQGLDEVRSEIYAETVVFGSVANIKEQVAAIIQKPHLITAEMVITHKNKQGIQAAPERFTINGQDEAKEKLGIDDVYFSNRQFEVIEYGGHFYLRDIEWDDHFFTALSDLSDRFMGIPEPSDGTGMCECGNKAFCIRFGDYTVYGICTRCNQEHELYSG